jgi:hypothetical protein
MVSKVAMGPCVRHVVLARVPPRWLLMQAPPTKVMSICARSETPSSITIYKQSRTE